ncbi:MAG TPA: ATPase, T2SS/T4P/T4SS family [Planctomycetota bacterium]
MDPKRLENLLAAMNRVGASALHLVPGRTPSLRVKRQFVNGDETPVLAAEVEEVTRDMLFSDHRARLAVDGQVEVLYVARNGQRYRATIAEAGGNHSLVLHPVPQAPQQVDALDLPEQVALLARCRSGLVLVAGFFGSGKSTTLAALVEALNQDPSRHIVTIEDSIRFVHQQGLALLHQREVGTHVASGADGIRQAMASGVDAIMVSDLCNADVTEAAIAAAESGCLVFAGIQAASIVGAITELTSMFPLEHQPRLRARLSRALRGAIAQSLLHRMHKVGRIPVVEVLLGNSSARTAIRNGCLQDLPAIMQRYRGLGMQTTDIALRSLLSRHLVAEDEALLHASNRDEVVPRGPSPAPAR